jgi:hypothetical protein
LEYPLEFIREERRSKYQKDKLINKDFKKVIIVLDNIVKINLNYLVVICSSKL